MKKILLSILSCFLCLTILTACDLPEQPHCYYETIDVKVTEIDKSSYFAAFAWQYTVKLTVYSKEYDITYKHTYKGQGINGCPKQWKYEKGDTVKAQLYTWTLDSTGEIVRREINKVY